MQRGLIRPLNRTLSTEDVEPPKTSTSTAYLLCVCKKSSYHTLTHTHLLSIQFLSKKLEVDGDNFISLENKMYFKLGVPLRKKYQFSEFFWSVFSHMRSEYGDLLCKSWYPVQIWETRTIKSSNTGTFHALITMTKLPAFISETKNGANIFITDKSRFKNNSKVSNF